jgi:hypothetical protein
MGRLKVNEQRILVVSIETAVDAVLELDRTHGGKLSTGKMVEAHIEEGKQPGLVLSMVWESQDGRTSSEKKWPLSAVAAALIHYCSRANIPLPRNSTKSIELVPEGFRLTLGTRTEINSLHSQPWRISRRRVSTDASQAGAGHDDVTDAGGSGRDPIDEALDDDADESASMVA